MQLSSVRFSALNGRSVAELGITTITGPIAGVVYEGDLYASVGDNFLHDVFMLADAHVGRLEKLVVRATPDLAPAEAYAYADQLVHQLEFESTELAVNLRQKFRGFNAKPHQHIVAEIRNSGHRAGIDLRGPSHTDDRAGWLRYMAPQEWKRDLNAETRQKQQWLKAAAPKPAAKAPFAVGNLRATWKELVGAGVVVAREPATTTDLDQFEEVTGFALPRELKALVALSNGADLPGHRYYQLLTVEQIAATWSSWKIIYDDWELEELIEGRDSVDKRVVDAYIIPGWIPIVDDNGNCVGFDRRPGPGGSVGQVVSYGRDEESNQVIAPDLVTFLRGLLG